MISNWVDWVVMLDPFIKCRFTAHVENDLPAGPAVFNGFFSLAVFLTKLFV